MIGYVNSIEKSKTRAEDFVHFARAPRDLPVAMLLGSDPRAPEVAAWVGIGWTGEIHVVDRGRDAGVLAAMQRAKLIAPNAILHPGSELKRVLITRRQWAVVNADHMGLNSNDFWDVGLYAAPRLPPGGFAAKTYHRGRYSGRNASMQAMVVGLDVLPRSPIKRTGNERADVMAAGVDAIVRSVALSCGAELRYVSHRDYCEPGRAPMTTMVWERI